MKKRIAASILALCMMLTLLPTSALAIGPTTPVTLHVSPSTAADDSTPRDDGAAYKTLQGAISAADNGDTIIIDENIDWQYGGTLRINKELTIKGCAPGITVTRQNAGGSLYIGSSGEIIFNDLILDGGAVFTSEPEVIRWNAINDKHFHREHTGITAMSPLFEVEGKLTFAGGTEVRNCFYEPGWKQMGGPAVTVDYSGELYLTDDAYIHDNEVYSRTEDGGAGGGAIWVLGKLYMRDTARIDKNIVGIGNGVGGGVFVNSGIFEMSGGTISNNYAHTGGGVAVACGGGKFTMSDGLISGNCAIRMGGGVGLYGTGGNATEFHMTGGEISNNTGRDDFSHVTWGGGVFLYSMNDSFYMTGGIIKDNATDTEGKGGGLYVGRGGGGSPATAVLLNGEFAGNKCCAPYVDENGTSLFGNDVSVDGSLYLDGAMKIEKDITLEETSTVELIGAGPAMEKFLVGTTTGFSTEGRAIVFPGSFTYNGLLHQVTDTEPYIANFSNNVRNILPGSAEATSSSDTGSLVLSSLCIVDFDINPPAGLTPTPATIAPVLGSNGDVIGTLTGFPTTAPTVPGYTFSGWTYDAAGTLPLGAADTLTNPGKKGNITLYGQWDPNATVTFKVVNGVWNDGSTADKIVSVPMSGGAGTLLISDVPTGMTADSGYTGGAWDITPNTTAGGITGDVTYTYSFTKPSSGGGGGGTTNYTLTYETNGGSKIASEHYTSGTTVKLTKTPSREGYTFAGWYADKALSDKITEIKMNGSKTVYAKWEAAKVPDGLNGDDHYAYIAGREDGLVHPNANITRAETATIFYRLLNEDVRKTNETAHNSFSDVSAGQWHNTAISTVAQLGIVKGRGDGIFDPDAPITRAEFAAIAARFDSETYSGADKFPDISGHWAAGYINRAAEKGWVQGDSGGNFRPNDLITRAEAITMINRVLQRLPESTDDLLPGMRTFSDNMNTSAWYYLAIQEASNGHDYGRKADGVHEKWTALTK